MADLRAREDAGLSDAKKGVGVLSEYAVAEARDSFWRAFAGGKSFAKRQSMWDLMFAGLRFSGRRDESTAAVVIRWLINLLFNFTLGLCGALGVFLWRLRALVASYQPNPLRQGGALAFTPLAFPAAAMVAAYLALVAAMGCSRGTGRTLPFTTILIPSLGVAACIHPCVY